MSKSTRSFAYLIILFDHYWIKKHLYDSKKVKQFQKLDNKSFEAARTENYFNYYKYFSTEILQLWGHL